MLVHSFRSEGPVLLRAPGEILVEVLDADLEVGEEVHLRVRLVRDHAHRLGEALRHPDLGVAQLVRCTPNDPIHLDFLARPVMVSALRRELELGTPLEEAVTRKDGHGFPALFDLDNYELVSAVQVPR